MLPVIEWLETNQLLGTARLFGGNTNLHPSGENNPYGYGFCAFIPENVEIPSHLKEMRARTCKKESINKNALLCPSLHWRAFLLSSRNLIIPYPYD